MNKSFGTHGLTFSFTNLLLSGRCTKSLSFTFPSVSLTLHLPPLLLYHIEKRCFTWPGSLKASPLLLSGTCFLPPATNSPLHFTLLSLHWDASKYRERNKCQKAYSSLDNTQANTSWTYVAYFHCAIMTSYQHIYAGSLSEKLVILSTKNFY